MKTYRQQETLKKVKAYLEANYREMYWYEKMWKKVTWYLIGKPLTWLFFG